jgi:hypothetical protein
MKKRRKEKLRIIGFLLPSLMDLKKVKRMNKRWKFEVSLEFL